MMREYLLPMKLSLTAKQYPDKIAVQCGKGSVSYRALHDLSNRLADALKKLGIKRGDRVMIQLGNSVQSIIAFWAVLKADAIVSMIGLDVHGAKLLYLLKDSGAKVFFTKSLEAESCFLQAQADLSLESVISLENTAEAAFYKTFLFADLLDKASLPELCYHALSVDLAAIIYTSGSTGDAKGVMLTHANMLAAQDSLQRYLDYTVKDVVICALPLAFDYGLYQMILSVSVGATLVLEEDFAWPLLFCRRLQKMRATILPLVPSMLALLHDMCQQKRQDFSSLKKITNTGAALTSKHVAMALELFPDAQIFSMYGLTECKRCTYLPPRDLHRKPGSVGIAIPNTELWVVDEYDQKVPAGVVGQLVIRGATVMKGYWNKPEETAKKLKDGQLPCEKILYTGDYAELDEEGYVYFRGRMDETFKSRGVKIAPKEIEECISRYADVKEVAVMGVDDVNYGIAVWAFVSSLSGKTLNVDSVQQHCLQHLSKEKRPVRIEPLVDLPKTANGKLDKKELLHKARLLMQESVPC